MCPRIKAMGCPPVYIAVGRAHREVAAVTAMPEVQAIRVLVTRRLTEPVGKVEPTEMAAAAAAAAAAANHGAIPMAGAALAAARAVVADN